MSALRNLLDNALRYGVADAPVVLRIHPAGQRIGFSVEDQGDGLSDADIAYTGNRFWCKGGGQGSGLGLSIVRAIVSRYQGSWELTRGSGAEWSRGWRY